jgi:hypothetical protein
MEREGGEEEEEKRGKRLQVPGVEPWVWVWGLNMKNACQAMPDLANMPCQRRSSQPRFVACSWHSDSYMCTVGHTKCFGWKCNSCRYLRPQRAHIPPPIGSPELQGETLFIFPPVCSAAVPSTQLKHPRPRLSPPKHLHDFSRRQNSTQCKSANNCELIVMTKKKKKNVIYSCLTHRHRQPRHACSHRL